MNTAIKKGALPKAIHELAVRDAKSFRSSQELRQQLLTELVGAGKTSESFDSDADPKFHKEMMGISRETMAERASDKGLTAEEKAQLPDGVYQIDILLDPDIKPSQLPAFMTEPGRIGKLSIKRYCQQQVNSWYRSVKDSMILRERQMALLTGGASARTKNEAELQCAALVKVVRRSQKSTEPVLTVAEVVSLIAMVNRLAESHDLANLKIEIESDSE